MWYYYWQHDGHKKKKMFMAVFVANNSRARSLFINNCRITTIARFLYIGLKLLFKCLDCKTVSPEMDLANKFPKR